MFDIQYASAVYLQYYKDTREIENVSVVFFLKTYYRVILMHLINLLVYTETCKVYL